MTRDPALNRRERRKLELRERILEAAAGLFRSQGFHQTKVARICAEADVAHKTFFNHFPSKLDVLREIAHGSVNELLIDIETARKEGKSTAERLDRFFSKMADGVLENAAPNRELVTELVHVLSESEQKGEQARKLHKAFGALVADGLAAGDVTRRHDAETLTEMIIGAYYVLMFNYANLADFPMRTQAEAVSRFLADALAPAPNEE